MNPALRPPTLAILVPAYNSQNTITATLRSIELAVNPHGPPVDVYVSDNHSTDATLARINAFANTCDSSRINLIVYQQASNLGAYGNMRFLQQQSKADWAYVLCADDTLHRLIIDRIYAEIIGIDASVSVIAFRDTRTSTTADRVIVERLNGSKRVLGKRGLALFFLYGCFVGSMSNCCFRRHHHTPTMVFNRSFFMHGDFNFYVETLKAGGAIYLSSLETNFKRPDSPLSSAGALDNKGFQETRRVVNKCIETLASTLHAKAFLQIYAHTWQYHQFYRRAVRDLLHFKTKSFRALCQSGKPVVAGFFCLFSFVMVFKPLRNLNRRLYQAILL